jgi:hypothetical protein
MKKLLRASLALAALSAAGVVAMSSAQAQCPARNCRYFFQPTVRNQWGYGGLVQTWGLGGPAMAPWTGGAIVGVTPYGPNPYDHVKPNGW